jgi:hypothetical protein
MLVIERGAELVHRAADHLEVLCNLVGENCGNRVRAGLEVAILCVDQLRAGPFGSSSLVIRRTLLGCRAKEACGPTTAAPQRSKSVPPPHSITSSARASRFGAMLRPSALAAWRLITRSNLVREERTTRPDRRGSRTPCATFSVVRIDSSGQCPEIVLGPGNRPGLQALFPAPLH